MHGGNCDGVSRCDNHPKLRYNDQMNEPSEFRLNTKEPQLISLIILSAFASMGAVLMTPALPAIMTFFHINEGQAQLTVTLFLVGYACGQLIYGPLANRFGRKPAFYVGIVIATIGSIFSILSEPADSYALLLVGRLLEALGSSAGLVISFTIIADFYYPKQSPRIISFMMMAFAIVPGIAVFIGGLIAEYADWQTCFYFLLVYGLVLFYPAYKLPETLLEKNLDAIKIKRIQRSYADVIKNSVLIRFSLIFGCTACLVYVFAADGPFIGIHGLGLSPAHYGMLALLPTIGMLIGALLSAKLTQRIRTNKLILLGAIIELIAAIVMLLAFIFHYVSMVTLLVPMFFIYFGHAFASSNAASASLFFAVDKANGSAVMNFICIALPVVGTLTLATLNIRAPYILPVILVAAVLILLSIWYSVRTRYVGEP
ncbi:MAG: MFS transporter [Coxiella sp. (in: Bacteria)]|nr:MAG: MFS transporter [Coxiella sp. (in: g-proteobacteria)]